MNDSSAPTRASSTSTAARSSGAATDAPARSRRPDFASLKPLLPFALAYRGRIVAALLSLVVAAMATLALPLAVRRVIDGGFGGEGGGVTGDALIDVYFGVLVLVVGVLALASSLRFYFVITLGDRIVADLRSAVFRHLANLDVSFFDRTKSGEIVSRLTADTTLVKSAFGASASIALRNLMLFAGALVMMIVTSPKLSGLVIGAIPFIVVPLVLSGRKVRERSRVAQDRLAETSAFAVEAVGAARVMQAYGMEEATGRQFAQASDLAYGASRDATLSRSILTGVAIFLVSASVVGILWYGAQQVIAGQMTGGRLSQFVLYAVFAASALGQLSEVYGEVSQAAGAASRIAEWLEVKPTIVAPPHPRPMPVPARGEVAFDNVVFAYPGREDEPVLRGLSFDVKAGETVALVGPSGAGKSTILQLVSRFYDPRSGIVRIDGLDLREVDPKEARGRIALVPQDPVVFGVSVRENIAYGRENASHDDVRRAAELAAAHDFIMALPQGYETLIGERGVTLSGGQRQRLALARAILRDAPILMLDEATSALDAESERAVQHALETVARGRTTLVVAHRLATVLKADRILVIDNGRIVEEGTHADLVAQGGLYARLARLQFASGAIDSDMTGAASQA
jgi:ATP-binding cassette subfamily B protein